MKGEHQIIYFYHVNWEPKMARLGRNKEIVHNAIDDIDNDFVDF